MQLKGQFTKFPNNFLFELGAFVLVVTKLLTL